VLYREPKLLKVLTTLFGRAYSALRFSALP